MEPQAKEVEQPPDQCRQANCSSRITPEYTFTSSEPDIANFVAQDPASTNLHKPFQDPANQNKPVLSPSSGLVCPFNAGSTVVTVVPGTMDKASRVFCPTFWTLE